MEIRTLQGSITEVESDALIVNLFEGVTVPGGATGAVDRALDGAISDLIESGEITGKLGKTALLHTFGKIAPKRVLVVGLGKGEEFDLIKAVKAAAASIHAVSKTGARTVTSIVHGAGIGGLDPADAARAVTEGTLLGFYRSDIYKTGDKDPAGVDTFTIVEMDASKLPEFDKGVREGRILAEATNDARTLANEPANRMTPIILSRHARQMAEQHGLAYEELDEKRMADLGMEALLSVARGSTEPPRLIVLRHTAGEGKPTVAFVGKGITFDSGGISIKPSEGMKNMKFDMAGGAAVVGAMRAVSELKPDVNILGLVPASENMPSGSAYKPGDVIKCSNGKTVEITNTDAEGRMIMADAITYAVNQGADWIVDVATLTGACVVALGYGYTGVMTNNADFLEKVTKAADAAGELVWELPMPKEYRDMLKSSIADIKNTGSRYGGAIQAGLFLQEFVDDTPWVHMDIAGTAHTPKDEAAGNGYLAPGATGAGVRTLAMLALHLGKQTESGGN